MDKIIYLVVAKPGGIDGMDHTDKGGQIKCATFDKKEAENALNAWHTLKKEVVNTIEITEQAFTKLDKIEKLCLLDFYKFLPTN